MKDKDFDFFGQPDETEMSELIEKYETDISSKTKHEIKSKAFAKAGLEQPESENMIKMNGSLSRNMKRFFAVAACVCVVLTSVAVGMVIRTKPQKPVDVITTEVTTNKSGTSNPLMLAISNGDDKMIDSLLSSKLFLSSDVLSYAIDCITVLSYNTIGEIAQAVYDAFGTTGLDPLIEKTLLGDSDGAIAELSKKDGTVHSYTDKLAFFFSVVFCNSETVDSFVKKGADLNSRDAAGNSIYQLAVKYGNDENTAYAKAHGIS
ncbi:MAG: hypothetical protein NC215_11460 [Ruminococcus sp.]|nr:hypothetical protein [Ruminococcus sp.]